MKRYNAIISLPLFFCLMISIETRAAEQFFIEGAFNNSYFPTSMPNAISINTGGNAGQYPDGAGQVPNIGDIKLQRSVFGSIVDGKLAYPNVINELLSEADSLMKSGAKYKTPTAFGGVGQTGIGSGAWDIRFPGVREMDSGKLLQIGDQDQNYFEENILVAAERYRAILQIDPYNSEAAKGLLQTYYERMVPQIFAGNTSNVWAFRNRVTEEQIWQTSTLLEEGLNFYKKAVDIFVELTQTLPDVKYLDGKAGNFNHDTLRIPDAGDNMAIAPKLLETYIRAVSYQAEVTANKVARWYLDDYEYPVFPFENSSKRKQIVDYINKQTSLIQNELVLANVFFGVFSVSNPIEVTDIGRVTQVIGDLLSSRDFIRDGYLSFAVSRNSAGAVTGESYGVYSPEFVPFLYRDPEGLVQFPNSYQNLYSRAKEIVERAITWEKDTRYEDRTFDSNQYELQNRLENIQSEYFSELTQLCGQIRDGEGNLVPDIVLALFPNEERLKKYSYKLAGETASGAIYNQWMRIDSAEMEVDAAMLDLESLVKEMAKKEEIAREIANGVENIAILYLENGEKLAALELQRGELLAQQTEYEDRKRSNLTGSILGIAASAAMAFATGGTSLVAQIAVGSATAILGIGQAYCGMSTANDIAKSSAETQRELAEINQQQQRIVTFEKAQVQFQERNNLLLKTESELHSMILRAERLKLNILMAEQREDMERAELSRLYGRVSFLLQEWGRANHFVANNPINRPDYRLIRDILMRDADEAFAYAQERCYLAAKAAEYRVNFDPNSLSNEINTAIKNIIKARWAKNLLTALDSLNDYIEDLQIRQSGRQTDSITLSLRHFIFQNNYIINNSTNNSTTDYPDPNQSVFETQVDENGNIINSDDAWKAFLKAHLTFDPDIKADKLEFIFSTSLNRPNAASGLTYKKNNPLHIPNSTGMLLSWTRDKFSAEWRYHQYPGQTIEHSFG